MIKKISMNKEFARNEFVWRSICFMKIVRAIYTYKTARLY